MAGALPTLEYLRDQVALRGYSLTKNQDEIDLAINDAYLQVVSMRRWRFLQDTVTATLSAGSDSVSLPTSPLFDEIEAVVVSDTDDIYEIEYDDPQSFRHRQWEYQGATGTPLFWTRREDQIVFTPKADFNYTITINVFLEPELLDSGSDEALVPLRYADAIVWLAVMTLATRNRDSGTYQTAQQQFSAAMRRLLSAYPTEQQQNSTHVQRSPHWRTLGGGTIQWRV